jgi:predicted thioesterase
VTRLAPGAGSDLVHLVGDADTAAAMGSGDVAVLATPRLLALAEAATVAALGRALEDGQTTVGSRIELEHLAASPVGTRVTVRAELTAVDGRHRRRSRADHPGRRGPGLVPRARRSPVGVRRRVRRS